MGLPPPDWPPGLGLGRARAGELPVPPVRDCGPIDARALALFAGPVLGLLLILLLALLTGAGDGVGDGEARKVDMF